MQAPFTTNTPDVVLDFGNLSAFMARRQRTLSTRAPMMEAIAGNTVLTYAR